MGEQASARPACLMLDQRTLAMPASGSTAASGASSVPACQLPPCQAKMGLAKLATIADSVAPVPPCSDGRYRRLLRPGAAGRLPGGADPQGRALLPQYSPHALKPTSFHSLHSNPPRTHTTSTASPTTQVRRNSALLDKYRTMYIPPGVPPQLPPGTPLLLNRVYKQIQVGWSTGAGWLCG